MILRKNLLAIASVVALGVPAYAQTSATSTGPKSSEEKKQTRTGTDPSAGTNPTSPETQPGGSRSTQDPSGQTGGSGTSGMSGQTGMSGQSGTAGSMDSSAAGMKAPDTTKVVGFLHHVNQSEIEVGKLAKDNSKSDQVKQFADRIIKDHEKAADDLKSFAKTQNIDLKALEAKMDVHGKRAEDSEAAGAPGSTKGGTASADMKEHAGMQGHDAKMQEHKASLEKLRGLKGPEFDREFANMMVQDHQKVIDKLTSMRTRISGNSDLTALIDKQLPVLKQHLAMAQKLQAGSKA